MSKDSYGLITRMFIILNLEYFLNIFVGLMAETFFVTRMNDFIWNAKIYKQAALVIP